MPVPYLDGRLLTHAERRARRDTLAEFLYRRAGSLGVLGIGVVVEENPVRVRFADGNRERIEFVVPGDYREHDIVLVAQIGDYQAIVARLEPVEALRDRL